MRAVNGTEVTLGAGTVLHDLPPLLDPLGLALQNMGDIDVQTISGATSTGTHGTGAGFGGLATRITGGDSRDGRRQRAHGQPAPRTPTCFRPSRSASARSGCSVDVTVDCVPSFVLSAVERPEPLDEVLDGWEQRVDESDHFEFYWFPAHQGGTHQDQHPHAGRMRRSAPLSPAKRWFDDSLMSNTLFAGDRLRCSVGCPR